MEHFIFFWDGPFSNFCSDVWIEYEGESWLTSEHIFMYEKAKFFGDTESMQLIKESKTPHEAKKLGRKVKNFDDSLWSEVREEKMRDALYAKFNTPHYKDILLKTRDSILVEASPYDRIWGIGFRDYNALQNRHKWGLNLLGKGLMYVRAQIIREANYV